MDFSTFVAMKTILIFGAGWLGNAFVEELVSSKHKIIVASRRPIPQKSHPNIEYRKIFFHIQSGAIEFEFPPPQKVNDIIVMLPPTQMVDYAHTIDSICRQFPSVGHFIFTSSTGVYEDHSGTVNEDGVLKKVHPVVLAERKIQMNFPNNATILRLAGLIGNDRHPARYFLKKKINPSGNAPVNLIHRKDILKALNLLLENPCPGIYNLCYPSHPTKSDYYGQIARKIFQTELEFENQGEGKVINGSKFANTFHYEYKYDIRDIDHLQEVGIDNK
tara:strand:+ start:5334 stop:6158 length:825 start_codon:yes stop_codon:yes gene_type:complete